MTGTRACLLAAASGTLLALAFPYASLWPLAWVALVPFLLALADRRPWAAAGVGYMFGLFFYGITLRWAAELDPPGSWVLWGLFVLIESTVPALLAAVVGGFSRRPAGVTWRPLAVACTWVLMEHLRTWGPYALTWSEISYSQLPAFVPVQLADLTGALGVSFIVVLVNACVAEAWRWRRENPETPSLPPALRRSILGCAALVALALGYGAVRGYTLPASSDEGVAVACVQPNVDPHEKWDPEKISRCMKALEDGTLHAASQGASLVIWPETAIPRPVLGDAAAQAWVQALARQARADILVGATERSAAGRFQNTAFLMTEDGRVTGRYDKMHLVPFGEFLPLRALLARVPPFDTVTDLEPGTRPFIFQAAGLRFGALICFESTFSGLCRQMVAEGAQALVVITNDGWFNRTSAAEHHLAMSAMRAIEQRMWVVQCGNTGVSAFIDPRGVAHEKTGLFVQTEIRARIPPSTTASPYQRAGDVFVVIVALTWFVCVVAALRGRVPA